jgi:hypothetical protein
MVAGTAAASPSVPELGNNVGIALVKVEAAQTSANAIVYKLDKRVLSPASQAVATATGDIIYASAPFTPARLAIGSTNQALGVTGGIPAWQASSKSVLTTTGDVMYASAANVPARLGIGSTSQVLTVTGGLPVWATPSGGVAKYKTSTQVFTTNTTYANITASSGNLAFDIAANETWSAQFYLPVTFGGTGGLKLQLTGPATPTLVRISGQYAGYYNDGGSVVISSYPFPIATVTAFSSAIIALASNGVTSANIVSGMIILSVLIVNGANAGTVTLQGAQNSASSTSTFEAECRMIAGKV